MQNFLLSQLRTFFRDKDQMGHGTIFKAIGKDDLHNVPLLAPPASIAKAFDKNHWSFVVLDQDPDATEPKPPRSKRSASPKTHFWRDRYRPHVGFGQGGSRVTAADDPGNIIFEQRTPLYGGFSEADLVEQPAIDLFATLGWQTANLMSEFIGGTSSQGRASNAT